MKDKVSNNRTAGKIAYVYTDENPNEAQFKGHYALNESGQVVGEVHLKHKGNQNPNDNLCALSQNGKYNYPQFSRLLPAIEVFDTDNNSIGYRFEYK